jgi:PKHD-type hydroxylase
MDWKLSFPQREVDLLNWYWFERGFSIDEINRTLELTAKFNYEEAVTFGTDSPNDEIRKSRLKWINNSHTDAKWLYSKVLDLVKIANSNLWNFDLISSPESIQYTEYHDGGGHYGYHVDIGPGSASHRKVSLVVQLSDPSEYEGGEFYIQSGSPEQEKLLKMEQLKGRVLAFPSFMIHGVAPVTKGKRESVVVWVEGPKFK